MDISSLRHDQNDILSKKEVLQGTGTSVMEMSHRGKEFISIASEAEADLRTLMDIPSNYAVLFLQGGATTQFSAIPLNLAGPNDVIDYLVTGAWSKKAAQEGAKYCTSNVALKVRSPKTMHALLVACHQSSTARI